MPSAQDGSGSEAYRPTSIDFINLPNPIEPSQPHAVPQKHPLNGTPHLEKARLEHASNRDLLHYLIDPSLERPSKRTKLADNSTLDLPKLPVRNNTAKRLRIPPTLSGLHQPPPNAGLLPSISTEQPQVPPPRQLEPSIEPSTKRFERRGSPAEDGAAEPDAGPPAPAPKARQRRKWSDQETEDLLKGVARFGIGCWTKIMNCGDYHFDNRTALDLKDRFRVCRPQDYKKPKSSAQPSDSQSNQQEQPAKRAKPKTSAKGPPREEVSPSKLKELGINEPFFNVGRRTRHEYSVEEDEALLKGFKKYGNAWAIIRKDPSLGLYGRRAADLRDRFRTRYRTEYGKTTSSSSDSVAKRAVEDQGGRADGMESDAAPEVTSEIATRKDEAESFKSTATRQSTRLPPFSLDDVFLNDPFDNYDDEENGEPIVLDRGILDWAGADAGKNSTTEASKNTGIDPLMTLKLPKPMSNNVLTALPSGVSASQNNTNSLPSLASVLPDTSSTDQVELPSLISMIQSMENDGRNGGGNFPSLDDLLS